MCPDARSTQECLLLQYSWPEHNHFCQQGRRVGSKRRRQLCEGVPPEEWECGRIGAIRDSLHPGQGDSARYACAHVRVDVCTAAACRELCTSVRAHHHEQFVYFMWVSYSCCTAEPMSGTGMDMTVEEETASGK